MNHSTHPTAAHAMRTHLVSTALYFILALQVTYPLWLAPGRRLEGLGDPTLNAWILAWDHFAIFHQICDFFAANVFWPYSSSLAFGEHLLTQAVLTLPLRLGAAAPATLHNISLIQGTFFSALGAHFLAWHYFRSWRAALAAGLAYGFGAYRIEQSGHVQLVHGEFLPLMVLAFERILAGQRGRWRLLLGLSALGQWLCSWYWAVFSVVTLAPLAALRLWSERRALPRGWFASLALPLAVAALLTLPMALPTFRLKAGQVLLRPPEVLAAYSARPGDFLAASQRSLLYRQWLPFTGDPAMAGERALWPGVMPWLGLLGALGGAAKMSWDRYGRKQPQSASGQSGTPAASAENTAAAFPLGAWLVAALLPLSLTFGPHLHWTDLAGTTHAWPLPYALAVRFLPFLDQIRVPARWMLPALLGLALLLAWAVQMLAGWRARRTRHAIMTLGAALLLAESLAAPAHWTGVDATAPPAMAWLERQPYPAPTLLLPVEQDGEMLDLAWTHQPFLNGSNGYFPTGHRTLLRSLEATFPRADTLALLRALGIRYVLIDQQKASTQADLRRLIQTPLPAGYPPPRILGRHRVIDLGQPEQDITRIEETLHRATQAAVKQVLANQHE